MDATRDRTDEEAVAADSPKRRRRTAREKDVRSDRSTEKAETGHPKHVTYVRMPNGALRQIGQ